MTKPEYPQDKAGSLLAEAWIERYNAEGGKGSVALWAIEHCKTQELERLTRKAFLGSRMYVLVNEKFVEVENGV